MFMLRIGLTYGIFAWTAQRAPAADDIDLGVSSAPFDCAAGVSNWRQGWSDAKKEYCCEHTKRGCMKATTSAPYD